MTTLHILLRIEEKLHNVIDDIMDDLKNIDNNAQDSYIINAHGKRVPVSHNHMDTELNSVPDTQLYSISDAVGIRNCFYAHDYPAQEALKDYYHADAINNGPVPGTFTLHRKIHTYDTPPSPTFTNWEMSTIINNGVIPTKILLKKYKKAERFEELLPYIPYGWVDIHEEYTQLYSDNGALNIERFNHYVHHLTDFAAMYEDNPSVKTTGPRIAIVELFND